MSDQLRRDIYGHPEVFWLKDRLEDDRVSQVSALCSPPASLMQFWKEFGAGLIFESERILHPLSEEMPLDLITSQERAKGLPSDLTMFHVGVVVSGYGSRGYEAFDAGTYAAIGHFNTLDEWYVGSVRPLFAHLYGMY